MAFPALHIFSQSEEQLISIEGIRRVSFGRGPGTDVCLPDVFMRPKHFEIYCVNHVNGAQYFLYDYGTRDGVTVNGNPVSNVRLRAGDVIEAGGSRITFRDCDDLVAILPERKAA